MHFLLFYELTPDYLERRAEFRAEHLAMAWDAAGCGELILGGALAEPVDGAVLLFEGDSPQVAERFASADPYVRNGLVTSWRVRPWTTVVGEHAATPVRSSTMTTIRPMEPADGPVISEAFAAIGWDKPVAQFARYIAERDGGDRDCWVATVDGRFAGYVTLNWKTAYPGLAGTGVPEIQDLNVLPEFRRRYIASRLLDVAEQAASQRCSVVGIGVGLHPGYNAAQRLYVKRGYIPDALGVTYNDRYVTEREVVRMDDDLVLHFMKDLPRR